MLADSLTAEGKRDRRSVAERLSHFVNDLGNTREILGRRNLLDAEALAQHLGSLTRQRGFVKALLRVADGIRTDRVARRKQIGGIHAAREEGFLIGQLGVRAFLGADFLYNLLDLRRPLVDALALVGGEYGREIAVQLKAPAVKRRPAARGEFINALVEGLRADGIAVEQVLLQHLVIQALFHARVRRDGVDVARAEQLSVRNRIEQLLLTDLIAADVVLLFVFIIEHNGKHAAELLRHVRAPLGVGVFENRRLAFLAAERQRDTERVAQALPIADIAAEIDYLNIIGCHV